MSVIPSLLANAEDFESGTLLAASVCVVGAGPAGITVARELSAQGIDVILIESGGTSYTTSLSRLPTIVNHHLFKEQQLARGESRGEPYYPLRLTRVRSFGGTSNALLGHGLRVRPLDEIDFLPRQGFDYHGWPFERDELQRYYHSAQRILSLDPRSYDVADWPVDDMFVDSATIQTSLFNHANRAVFNEMLTDVVGDPNIQLITHANLTELEVEPGRPDSVSRADLSTLSGVRFAVTADQFVLALGGIENARMLLASRRVHQSGIGNDHDLVGRFFQEHPHITAGFIRPSSTELLSHAGTFTPHEVNGSDLQATIQLRPERLTEHGLLNAIFHLTPVGGSAANRGPRAWRTLRRTLHHGPWTRTMFRFLSAGSRDWRSTLEAAAESWRSDPPELLQVDVMAEQEPNPDSRVTLSHKRDAFGMPLAKLAWRRTPRDRMSIQNSIQLLDAELSALGLGEIESPLGTERPPQPFFGGWHHMGTTRMHNDRTQGVVDADCRVHGMTNLYVAGSSVFPTGGAANPTLTLIALALRLAAHLLSETKSS